MVATLVVLKTGLGIIEALSLAIVVGLSVDYVIHLGHAYHHSVLLGRYLRSRSALDMRASSVPRRAIGVMGLPGPGAVLSQRPGERSSQVAASGAARARNRGRNKAERRADRADIIMSTTKILKPPIFVTLP